MSVLMQKQQKGFLGKTEGPGSHEGTREALHLLAETMHRFLLSEDEGAGDPNGVEAKAFLRRISMDLMRLSENLGDDCTSSAPHSPKQESKELQKLRNRLDEEQAIDEQLTSSYSSAAASVQTLLHQVESYKTTLALARRTPGGLRTIELENDVKHVRQLLAERDKRLDLAAAESRNLSAMVQASQAETAAVAHELLEHKQMVKTLLKQKKAVLTTLRQVRTGQHVKQLEQRSRAQQRVIGTMQDEFDSERAHAKHECQADKDSLSESLGEMREEAQHLSNQVVPLQRENQELKDKIKQLQAKDVSLVSDKQSLLDTIRAKFLQSQTTTTTEAPEAKPLSLLNLADPKNLEGLQLEELCQAAGRQAEEKAQSEVEEAEAEAQAESEPEEIRRLKAQMQLMQQKLNAEKQRSAAAQAALQKFQRQVAENANDFRAGQEKQEHAAEEQQGALVAALADKAAEEATLKEEVAQRSALLENQAVQLRGDPEALAALEADQRNQEEAEAEATAEADEIAQEASGAALSSHHTAFVEMAKTKRSDAASRRKHKPHHHQTEQERPEAAAEMLMRQAQMVFN